MKEVPRWITSLLGDEDAVDEKLQIDVEERDGAHQIKVHGRLVIDTTDKLLDVIRRLVRRAQRLELELSAVDFIDSSGIAVLIQGLKLAQTEKVQYVLVDPSPKVRAVLELSQLQDFFGVETTG